MRRAFIVYCVLVVTVSSFASWRSARNDWTGGSSGRAWSSGSGSGSYGGGFGGGRHK